jgi:P2 family phage contractile tail tube protein
MPNIEKVLNANVYVNGNNFLGKAREVRLPTISVQKTEHRPLGTFATIALPQGIERMEMSIIFETFNADVFKKTNPFAAVDLAVRAVQQEYDAHGNLVTNKQVRIFAKGSFRSAELGNISAQEPGTRTLTFDLNYYKLVIEGLIIHEIDPLNSIYIVNGEDLLASVRALLP